MDPSIEVIIEDADENESPPDMNEEENDENPPELIPSRPKLQDIPEMTWRQFMQFMPQDQRSALVRQLAHAKIEAKRRNRRRMSEDDRVVDKRGKVRKGARQVETVDFDWDKLVPKNQLMEACSKLGYIPTNEEIQGKAPKS